MPDLFQYLCTRDIGFLRITATFWGIELSSPDKKDAAGELCKKMLNQTNLQELVNTLPPGVLDAIKTITRQGGRTPWPQYIRQFGEFRVVGPGSRDRKKVYQNPISIAETLVYHSFIASAIFDTSKGLQEFAFIPTDLLEHLRELLKIENPDMGQNTIISSLGRPANAKECKYIYTSSGKLLDDLVTLISALRLGIDPPALSIPVPIVTDFISSAGLIIGDAPSPSKLKIFLELPVELALEKLGESWMESETFNELHQLKGLIFEGEWQNFPQLTRQVLLNHINRIPIGTWWNLQTFIDDMHSIYPDFQRPAGDFDSWFIKRKTDGSYLRGINTWYEVDGALIDYLICGPMHWLGKVDLASADQNGRITAFRLRTNPPQRDESAKLSVSSDGKIIIPRFVSRLIRYQVSRFCDWEEEKSEEYVYRISVNSLHKATEQGLNINQFLNLLTKNARSELPPILVNALHRWASKGMEAEIGTQIILQVKNPEVIEKLQKSKASRFLGDMLNPTTISIMPGAKLKVISALAEIGILTEDKIPGKS